MTKIRDAVTIENTLYRVLGEIFIERAAEVTGRSTSYLRSLTDPDKRERLTIEDAIALDLEYRETGREGYPLLDTYTRIVEAAAEAKFAESHATGRLTYDFVKEAGEASCALIAAQLPGATLKTLETALHEVEQADNASAVVIAHLQNRIRRARDGPDLQPPDG
jgi:hypothetical protein